MKIKRKSYKVLGILSLFFVLSMSACSIFGCETCTCDGEEYLACDKDDIAWYESTGCTCE